MSSSLIVKIYASVMFAMILFVFANQFVDAQYWPYYGGYRGYGGYYGGYRRPYYGGWYGYGK
jgi:hypothetical protein